jgi:hypothetical protein
VVCFVAGFAVFGSGAFAGYSSLLGFLHVSGWLVIVGVIGMVLGLGLILGGGFGGRQAASGCRNARPAKRAV